MADDGDSQDRDRYRRYVEPFIVGLTTHRLREGLPDVPWAMFFGPAYVELFGRERLLKTPAARVEELAGGVLRAAHCRHYDVAVNRESYLAAQKAAREHLDSNAFAGDACLTSFAFLSFCALCSSGEPRNNGPCLSVPADRGDTSSPLRALVHRPVSRHMVDFE